MPTTVMGLIRSEIRRIVDRRQKPPRRLERRLATLESKLRALTAAVRKAGRRPALSTRGAAPAADAPSGAQIRALRERMGFTREVFAKRLQVSPSIIFLWESGRSRPSRRANVEALQKLFRGATGGRAAAAKSGARGSRIDGRVIRAVRARLGLSREKFAKRVGVSPSMIFLWESGRSSPRRRANLEKLQALAGEAGAGGGMRAQRAARRNAGKRRRRG
jgi:DNA-binding transcriptional regulator YiaG